MSTKVDTPSNLRFFSDSSLFEKQKPSVPQEDPMPFGLNLQEPLPKNMQQSTQHPVTMSQCPTNTPSGPDSCFDIDYEF